MRRMYHGYDVLCKYFGSYDILSFELICTVMKIYTASIKTMSFILVSTAVRAEFSYNDDSVRNVRH